MRVFMMLADAAQVADGKLYILGGGWSMIGPNPGPFAIAVKLEVPWDAAEMQHTWRLELTDDDGAPVVVAAPDGDEEELELEGTFEVERNAAVKPGSPLDIPLAVSFGPVPFSSGRYSWRFSIDDVTDEHWQLSFAVRDQIIE